MKRQIVPSTQQELFGTPPAPPRPPPLPRWSNARVLALAAGGAAIGFNNFWQFPLLLGYHGGSAFLLVYLGCLALIGVPLVMAELLLGRLGRASPVGALANLANQSRADPHWAVVGGMGVLVGFLVFSYLSVIAGWTLAYTLRSLVGAFTGLTADGIASQFALLVKDPEKQLFWFTLFMAATLLVSARGLRGGLQVAVRLAVPLILILFVALVIYAATTEGFGRALTQLALPDFTRIGVSGLLAALAHALFTLGVGTGVMTMYGAYAGPHVPLARVTWRVAALDTITGVAAAVIVFAVLFSGGVEPVAGTALVFQALPLAFDHLPLGGVAGTVFFLLLALVAWVSALAFVEAPLAWLGERFGLSRARAASVCGMAAWTVGVVVILSFNAWSFSFKFFGTVKKLGMFDILQILTAHLLLPLGAILLALFAGWLVRPALSRDVLAFRSPCSYDTWLWTVRLLAPLLLLVVIVSLSDLFA
jgi:NSS family neurotransmitter:Na+ symporter